MTENSPSINQVVINGAFAFDNIFMINGVDVNDNLRAQPQNLYVEDAIQETQVLTSGISAEYGRFTGGVINAVTKSGGNTFSGSYRLNFVNPAWTVRTPIETSNRLDKLSGIHEATLGGPIMQDRLWFFGSGRYENTRRLEHAAGHPHPVHADHQQQARRDQADRRCWCRTTSFRADT